MPRIAGLREASPGDRPLGPVSGVSICVVRDGRALLAQRAKNDRLKGLWSLPGGHVELGETLREAALRELREETSVKAEIKLLLDTIDIIHRDPEGRVERHYVLTVFGAEWTAGEAVAASDAAAVRWASPSDVDALPMTPGTADLVRRAVPLLMQG